MPCTFSKILEDLAQSSFLYERLDVPIFAPRMRHWDTPQSGILKESGGFQVKLHVPVGISKVSRTNFVHDLCRVTASRLHCHFTYGYCVDRFRLTGNTV